MAGTAQRPKSDEPALSPNSNVTPLPTGVTPVLDKAPAIAAADYSVFELPGVNHPPALSPNSNVTPLPTGATPVLDKGPAVAAADYSVFELPAVNDPLPPPEARGLGPVPVVPKLQPPASPQASLPVSDHLILWKSPRSRQEFLNPGHSLEERLGLKGILLLALSAGISVFILGYVVFLTLLTWFN